MTARASIGVALWVGFFGASAVAAQSLPVGDTHETYLRVLQLSGRADPGSFTVRPLSAPWTQAALAEPGHPWSDPGPAFRTGASGELSWSLGDSRTQLFVNAGFPWGWNDGAVWMGKGVTTVSGSRAWLAWRGLSLTLEPTLLFNQNADVELAPVGVSGASEYAYPWRVIDYPQRFGPDSYWTFDVGQSQLSFEWRGVGVGFGSESLWWGPGIQNAIVMSSNAPGFLHASFSTKRPLDIGIGTVEGRWIWGGLGQSDYFDPALAGTDRFITGIVLSYSPSFLPGLSVGGTRVFQELVPVSGLDASEYLLVFQGLLKSGFATDDDPTGNDDRDQLLSLFARWLLPESGFEGYVEWARNDHSWNFEDLILEPEHSRGYTLGFQKLTSFSRRRAFVLRAEITHLESSPTFQVRPRPTYYEHGVVRQGYTHKGQILGAMVGPGGNGQFLGFDWYDRWGSATLFANRRVADNDAYWVWAESNGRPFHSHDVSFDFGLSGRKFTGRWELGGAFVFTRQLNRYITGPHITNVHLAMSARWRPGER